ncbi:MAG: DUF924 family protein [Candidatus Puniceispirillales bacterium WSBS_2018_MAG_OTU23]
MEDDIKTTPAIIADINNFWFIDTAPKQWFIKDDQFDATLKKRFEEWVVKALAGSLDAWADTPMGTLALILLLDQMTRNIYRNTPAAFSGDAAALALSLNAVHRGYLDEMEAHPQQFLLMPMMHSEDINIQNQSLPLFKKYTSADTDEYAKKHQVIIARFGRFPHRNAVLGRVSSEEEIAFLKEPNSSF